MQHKRLFILLSGFLSLMQLSADYVSPQDALDIAARFNRKSSSMSKSRGSAEGYSVAYTASEGHRNCFYIVNSPASAGYTIVTADSRMPEVLGYVENGEFNVNNLPCNMRWWLEEYKREIAYFLNHDINNGMESSDATRQKTSDNSRIPQRKSINPLLGTKWNQNSPYNLLCPIDPKTNKQSVTGCVATAMAQVMKFHNWPESATGSIDDFSFEGTAFDWDEMLNEYTTDNYTEKQGQAVAELMLNCGRSVKMKYGSSESSAVSREVGVALLNYFGYDSSIHYNLRDYFTQAEWDDLVYSDLAKGHPVYYHGRTPSGGHAFVCDGYAGNGYFHFNWGWGGSQDGYFRLFALNPASGGIGSYQGGYNSSQGCFTGVIPKSDASLPQQKLIVMSGALKATQESSGRWKLTFIKSDDTEGMVYNPTVIMQDFRLEYRMVPIANTADTIMVAASSKTDLKPNYGWKSQTIGLPSGLQDGEYEFFLTYTPAGENYYRRVKAPQGLSDHLKCTVKDGVPSFSEYVDAQRYSLIMNGVSSADNHFYVNGPSAIRLTFSNVGHNDFTGPVIVSLAPANKATEPIYSLQTDLSVPAGFSTIYDFSRIAEGNPGEYVLTAHTADGAELIGSPLRLSLEESPIAHIETEPQVEAVGILPAMQSESSRLDLSCTIRPTALYQATQSGRVRVRLYSLSSSRVWTWTLSANRTFGSAEVKFSAALNIEGLSAGKYEWQLSQIVDGKDVVISRRYPFTYYKEEQEDVDENTLIYLSLPDNLTLSSGRYSAYRGTLEVPGQFGGKELKELAPDAFTFAEQLESLTLPANIRNIGAGQFYCAKSLSNLSLESEVPPALSDFAFAPGSIEKINLNVPDSTANIYKRTSGWNAFKFGEWQISVESDIKILKGLATDGQKFYNPYYVSGDETLSLSLESPEGAEIFTTYIIGEDTVTLTGNEINIPALYGRSGRIYISSSQTPDRIQDISAYGDNRMDVYSLSGVLLIHNADKEAVKRLEPGIYIIGARKLVVK